MIEKSPLKEECYTVIGMCLRIHSKLEKDLRK